jgi:hypothetical protein
MRRSRVRFTLTAPMSYKNTQRWRTKAKRWLNTYMGGCCQSCGYNFYGGNLVGHHLIDKEAGLSRLVNSCASWERIIAEADKCVLLCHNCQGEIHAGLRPTPCIDLKARRTILAAILIDRPMPKPKPPCKACGKPVPTLNSKYCSDVCHTASRQKIKWPDNISELVSQQSMESLARSLGVSSTAIRKRLRNKAPFL